MAVMIFIVGALLGLLVGVAIYVRNIRQEVPARLAFSMHLVESRLSTLQSSVDQALARRHHDEVEAQRRDRVLD
jgi:glucose-6-phosphate-specific signal transduction histidine kinase